MPFGKIDLTTTIAEEVITRINKEEIAETPQIIEEAKRANEERLIRLVKDLLKAWEEKDAG